MYITYVHSRMHALVDGLDIQASTSGKQPPIKVCGFHLRDFDGRTNPVCAVRHVSERSGQF